MVSLTESRNQSSAPPQATRRARRRRGSHAGLLYVAPALLLVIVFFAVPVVMSFGMSFFDWPLFGDPTFIGLDNYLAVLQDEDFGNALIFTTEYTAFVTPLLFAIGLGLASLMRHNRPGIGIFRTVYFLPVVIGFASTGYLWVWMLNSSVGVIDAALIDLGVIDEPIEWLADPNWSMFWIIIMVIWKSVGFTMLLLMVGMQGISEDYYDAAKVDGAGALRRFVHITMPLLRRHTAMVLILSVISSYLAFDQFYILTGGGPSNQTITAVFWIYKMGFTQFQLGYAAALSMVLMLILVALSAVQMRLLRQDTD